MIFDTKLESLHPVLECVRKSVMEQGICEKELRKIEVAVEEAFINIISYAGSDKLEVNCSVSGGVFEIEMVDWGVAFNPLEKEIAIDASKPVEERAVGGLGIHLIQEIMDEVSYLRDGEMNRLQLRKSLAN